MSKDYATKQDIANLLDVIEFFGGVLQIPTTYEAQAEDGCRTEREFEWVKALAKAREGLE